MHGLGHGAWARACKATFVDKPTIMMFMRSIMIFYESCNLIVCAHHFRYVPESWEWKVGLVAVWLLSVSKAIKYTFKASYHDGTIKLLTRTSSTFSFFSFSLSKFSVVLQQQQQNDCQSRKPQSSLVVLSFSLGSLKPNHLSNYFKLVPQRSIPKAGHTVLRH